MKVTSKPMKKMMATKHAAIDSQASTANVRKLASTAPADARSLALAGLLASIDPICSLTDGSGDLAANCGPLRWIELAAVCVEPAAGLHCHCGAMIPLSLFLRQPAVDLARRTIPYGGDIFLQS